MGRPKGSGNRPVLRNYFTREEIERLVNKLKKQAETDPNLLKFITEQIFGKAVQPLGNDEGKALVIKFDDSFHEEK